MEWTRGARECFAPAKPRTRVVAAADAPARNVRGARRGDDARRDAWSDAVRRLDARDPCAALARGGDDALRDVCVVFCSPKTASNVGAFARACAAFECVDLRTVSPTCDCGSRAALSAAKGAQGVARRAGAEKRFDALRDALVGCERAVAFSPWREEDVVGGRRAFDDLEALVDAFPGGGAGGKLALVFGNEADGLTREELETCDAVCSIPMGRLVESLSVTHAGVIALSRYYERRVRAGTVERR